MRYNNKDIFPRADTLTDKAEDRVAGKYTYFFIVTGIFRSWKNSMEAFL